MKKNLLLAIFFLTVITLEINAQVIQTQKGLTTIIFNNPAGSIKVYLPLDIRPGDIISGSINTDPVGKNVRQIEKNLAQLKKYSIDFNGKKIPVSNTDKVFHTIIINENVASNKVSLINSKGAKEAEVNLPVSLNDEHKTVPATCGIPSHALIASPLRITGPFDGDASNTKCTVGSLPCEIIAESNRGCFIKFPENVKGINEIKIAEKENPPCKSNISAVDMNVSANKLSLLKGEKTQINVAISGLQQLPSNATLDIVNKTENIVVLQGGNQQKEIIAPA